MKTMTMATMKTSKQHGVGMVEILVALMVMSIGVLGFAGLQLQALDSTGQAYLRSQATALAQDVTERIMANTEALTTYANSSNWTGTPASSMPQTCVNNACTINQVASWDIAQTRWQAANLLPNGDLAVSGCNGSSAMCVMVAWNATTTADCQNSSGVVSGVDCVVLEVVE